MPQACHISNSTAGIQSNLEKHRAIDKKAERSLGVDIHFTIHFCVVAAIERRGGEANSILNVLYLCDDACQARQNVTICTDDHCTLCVRHVPLGIRTLNHTHPAAYRVLALAVPGWDEVAPTWTASRDTN